VLKATQAASGNYTAATATTTFAVTGAVPSLTFASIGSKVSVTAAFAVTASSNSQGAIIYSVVSGPATLSGNLVSVTGAGTVTLMAYQAASGNYTTGTATTSFTVVAAAVVAPPALQIETIGTQSLSSGSVSVAAYSTSPAAINYRVLSGPATISGNRITFHGAGTVVVQASQAATKSFAAVTATASFTITSAATPTLTISASRTKQGYALSAQSNSTGGITFSVLGGPAVVRGSNLVLSAFGTVIVQATQTAAGDYTAATTTLTIQAGN
jgi:hypothetical protein